MTTELEPQVHAEAKIVLGEDSTMVTAKTKSDEVSSSTTTTLHHDVMVDSTEGVAVAAEMDNGGVEDVDEDEEEDTEAEEMELEQAVDDEEDDMAEIDPRAIIERRTRGVKLTYDAAPLPAEDEDDPEDEDVVMDVDDQ
ncbi:hypothetical protein BJ742DRAFT_854759 [Cladochytrium replicatum]|nr:hypothetical protein BJ742DRAFT_854759 [Cladochytrium replicatum]